MKKRHKPIPYTEATAHIEKLSHEGRGIAHVDGKITFIQGALPGETVVFHYTKRKRELDEGQVVSVTTPSPHRVEPQCKHYGVCGGCSMQHLDSNTQIIEKQTLFLDILQRIGHCKPESLLPPLTDSHWHYRNKARLSVRYNDQKHTVHLGFRKKHFPDRIAQIDHCPILNQRVDEQLLNLRQLIGSLENPAAIAQVEVAAGDGDVALIFRNLAALSASDEAKLIAFGEMADFRIFLQPGRPDSVYSLYPENASAFLSYRLPADDISFSFHPTDFTQVNSGLNRLMVSLAIQLLDLNHNDVVLDLFCGLGNFSLPIAKKCTRIIGIEGSETMVERATMNASLNGITNAEFFSANLEDVAAFQTFHSHTFSKLLIDPPRLGAFEIVKRIELINPEKIVYVSCNPATLARDADVLVNQKGYRMITAGVMDMFPQSAHVESIALFEKR